LEATSKPLQPFVAVIVRTLRQALGWSQEELALAVGVKPSEISVLESGKRNSTLWTLQRVAQPLGVTCPQLLWMAEMLQRRVEREKANMQG
jgi:transcriptional regulator with XRE-family HTH domain